MPIFATTRNLLLILLIGHVLSASAAGRKSPESIAARQIEQLGSQYKAVIDRTRRIIYISALDKHHLQRTSAKLAHYCDAQIKTLLINRPKFYLTIILPTIKDYRKMKPGPNVMGFYQSATRTLTSIDRGRVLLHEFTHALHHADQIQARQIHPIWVWEGLATLFESAPITSSGLEPKLDARLGYLQRAIRTNSSLPFRKLFSLDVKDFSRDANLAYSQSRYVMLYLYRQKALRIWYEDYKRTFAADKTGQAAMERALARPLYQIEREWKKWVLSLKNPSAATLWRSRQGRLGVKVVKGRGGVKVVGFLPNSPAVLAHRIKKGDIIEKYNGRIVRSPAHFAAAVRATGALKTVTIQLIRNGIHITIFHPLGAPR